MQKGEDFVNTYVLIPEGSATKIDRTLDFPKPSGFGGAMFPLVLGGFIKPATNKGMKMLKANLEAGAAPGSAPAHGAGGGRRRDGETERREPRLTGHPPSGYGGGDDRARMDRRAGHDRRVDAR